MILLVDGFNIIHSSKRYRKLCERDLQLAIDRLIHDLIDLTIATEWDIKVVFDGRGQGSSEKIGAIEVVFSAEGQSADTVIERMVFDLAPSGPLTVATSDYAQQKVIFRQGVVRMSARELEARLVDVREEAAQYNPPARRTVVADLLSEDLKRKLRDIKQPPEHG